MKTVDHLKAIFGLCLIFLLLLIFTLVPMGLTWGWDGTAALTWYWLIAVNAFLIIVSYLLVESHENAAKKVKQ